MPKADKPGSGHQTKPYASASRPATKKSPWSLSNLFNYFNPLKSRSDDDAMDTSGSNSSSEYEDLGPKSPAHSLSTRGQQIENSIPGIGRPPTIFPSSATFPTLSHQAATPPPDSPTSVTSRMSPSKNAQEAHDVIDSNPNLSQAEKNRLKYLFDLENSGTPEPVKLTRSRSTTPLPPPRSPSPRKPLTKNPNGTYRWEGGGSSKSRNRYYSPAFGPSRSTPERLVMRESPEKPLTFSPSDTKRRRVGDDALTSVSTSAGSPSEHLNTPSPPRSRSAAPAPSPTRVALTSDKGFPFPISNSNGALSSPQKGPPVLNGSTTRTNGSSTAPMFPRTPFSKPTAPAIPSPLRQAWNQSPSSASGSEQSDASPSRQTKAANFMSELIKEVTPVKRPDVSNPYQNESPVQITSRSTRPPRRRQRVTGKPTPPPPPKDLVFSEKEKKEAPKQYSAMAIVEATIPKGSKRARPPANIRSTPPATPATAVQKARSKQSVTVEEVSDEEDSPPSKRAKPTVNGSRPKKPSPAPTPASFSEPEVIEVDDDEPTTSPSSKPVFASSGSTPSPPPVPATAPTASTKSSFSNLKATAPKEPSKLRFSFKPETKDSPSPPNNGEKAQPFGPPPVEMPATPANFTFNYKPPEKRPLKDPKLSALETPVASLPAFTFPAAPPPLAISTPAANKARDAPPTSLPTFNFSTTKPPVQAFDWSKFNGKKDDTPAEEVWTCTSCYLKTPAFKDKCVACEADRPGAPKAVAPTQGFDWAAAGLKPPTVATGSWKCTTCDGTNTAATEKCVVCEAPKP